ncbi:hypothetical protein T492DRAFT_864430 [Pavlovales sp. CCMP2436]|nr:hypothetical protein T492DRAFT_864430 [Pavlovales sp. CCMP2436]
MVVVEAVLCYRAAAEQGFDAGQYSMAVLYENGAIGPIEAKPNTVKPIRGIVIGAFGEVSADTHSLVKEIAAQGGRKMYALMGMLLTRLSALAPIAAQRGNTTNSNQQIISLTALARAHYRRSIGTRGGAQASAAN